MISISDLATIPIEAFPLAWRWTQPSHAVLGIRDLASMRAIDSRASRSLLKLLTSTGVWRHLQTAAMPEQRALDASQLDDGDVEEWLRSLPVPGSSRAWLCYAGSDALELPWSLFVDRWAAFCYPSSDDLIVVPGDTSWVLEYWHYEAFVWFPRQECR